jgi:hypothetical protein
MRYFAEKENVEFKPGTTIFNCPGCEERTFDFSSSSVREDIEEFVDGGTQTVYDFWCHTGSFLEESEFGCGSKIHISVENPKVEVEE